MFILHQTVKFLSTLSVDKGNYDIAYSTRVRYWLKDGQYSTVNSHIRVYTYDCKCSQRIEERHQRKVYFCGNPSFP